MTDEIWTIRTVAVDVGIKHVNDVDGKKYYYMWGVIRGSEGMSKYEAAEKVVQMLNSGHYNAWDPVELCKELLG